MDIAHKGQPVTSRNESKGWYKSNVAIIVLLFLFWPVGVFLMWRYAAWKLPVKIVVSVAELLFFIIFWVGVANAAPYVSLNDSYNSIQSTDDTVFAVSGSASSSDNVKVNGVTALRSGDDFKANVPVKEGDNQVTVVASRGDKQTIKTFIVHRNTQSEIKAREDAVTAAKKASDDANAKKAADDAAQAKAAADAKAKSDAAAAAKKAEADAAAAAAKAKANAPADYKSALSQATSYANVMHMSKQGVYDQLVSQYGGQFSAAAAQYAIDNVVSDWNANALAKARSYQDQLHLSPAAIHDQLTSSYGEKFTESEADYAIQNL